LNDSEPPDPERSKPIPTEQWIVHRPFDWTEYLDRPAPVYEGDDEHDETSRVSSDPVHQENEATTVPSDPTSEDDDGDDESSDPFYEDERVQPPIRLRTMKERDALIAELFGTNDRADSRIGTRENPDTPEPEEPEAEPEVEDSLE
jgi:hypothetical protein